MRNRRRLTTTLLLLGGLMLAAILSPVLMVPENKKEESGKEGWGNFLDVLSGNEGKFKLAVQQLEQSSTAAHPDVFSLYTLGRAYFYDAITHNHLASAEMAERTFARVLEKDPKHEALAFHGSVLTILSQGKDLEMFKQGVREMNLAVEHNPNSLTARLSRGITAQVLLEKIRTVKPEYDPVDDLEFACHAFEGIHSHYAPQAEFGSKAFLGESYMLVGDKSKAQSTFKAALAVPLPSEPRARAGRDVLQKIIQKRLNGSEQNLSELLRENGLGSCNICHLQHSGKQELSLKTPGPKLGIPVETPHSSLILGTSRTDLEVNVTGLKSREGQVRVALFDSEGTFLQNPVKAGIAEMDSNQCHWRVTGLPSGFYAVAIYQDENGNGKLDRNMLGMPLEPYGFSNNARGILGPPNFREACFQVTGSDTRIEVNLE